MSELVEAGRRVAAQIVAEAVAMGDAAFTRSIWKEAGRQLPKDAGGGLPPVPANTPAERGWNCRIMLFGPNGDLEADSQPDSNPEDEPAGHTRTLAHTGTWLRDTANLFHNDRRDPLPLGLDAETLGRSILSLRVSLSRNGGACWWRVPYTIGDDVWRAMVRVQRATE